MLSQSPHLPTAFSAQKAQRFTSGTKVWVIASDIALAISGMMIAWSAMTGSGASTASNNERDKRSQTCP